MISVHAERKALSSCRTRLCPLFHRSKSRDLCWQLWSCGWGIL